MRLWLLLVTAIARCCQVIPRVCLVERRGEGDCWRGGAKRDPPTRRRANANRVAAQRQANSQTARAPLSADMASPAGPPGSEPPNAPVALTSEHLRRVIGERTCPLDGLLSRCRNHAHTHRALDGKHLALSALRNSTRAAAQSGRRYNRHFA